MPGRRSAGIGALLPGILVACLSLASCFGGRPPVPNLPAARLSPMEEQLRLSVAPWIGMPHCLGGEGGRCIDCSGFVRKVYASVFHLALPRTSEEMRASGQRISTGSLAPGDLLVYRISKRRLHVGIYLGHGEFAHASTSRGVMISRVQEGYWSKRLLEARRLI